MRLRSDGLRAPPSPLRRLLRPPGRQTNQALLVVLLITFGTGVATVAVGSPDGAWVAVGHGICGIAVVLLIPWKSRVVRGGLRRVRPSRWLSLLLAALALFTLMTGLGYATGWVRSIAGRPGLWVHIAVALALVPLVVWHVWARGIRARRTDPSRRALLRAGVLAAGAVVLYTADKAATSVLGLPGARQAKHAERGLAGGIEPDRARRDHAGPQQRPAREIGPARSDAPGPDVPHHEGHQCEGDRDMQPQPGLAGDRAHQSGGITEACDESDQRQRGQQQRQPPT